MVRFFAGYSLRNRTIWLTLRSTQLLSQNYSQCMWNFVLPYLFNPDQANLGAKTAFIFGGFSIFCCVYLYFYHPETKGRSYQELDELFAKGVPARQFASYVTDAQTEAIRVKQRVQDGELSL